jgi:hypothetical protein
MLTAVLVLAGFANAQSYECDDRYQECGTPEQSGGGGCGGGGSILVNNTDLGDTYQYADDYDDDGIEDPYDSCVFDSNVDQADDDGDGIGTVCDNCASSTNALQEDADGDLFGDVCDDDIDGDAIANAGDLCQYVPDPLQKDTDQDRIGDACDDDMDNDGVLNLDDNCALVANPDQLDDDPGTWGDACDDDDDGDGIRNTFDNCAYVANYDQADLDVNAIGDACDADIDGDLKVNADDNCQMTPNPDQIDEDRDLVGDLCDDRYCFVVDGDVDNCLDPTDAFKAYTPSLTGKTGEEIRPRLFTNRENQPVRYTWTVVEAPRHSNAVIENPIGAASVSTPYEYHYLADESVAFTADVPGTYTLKVSVEQVWADDVTGAEGLISESTMTFEAEGDSTKGCSAVPFSLALSGTLGLAALSAGLVVMRRRED